MEKNLCKITFKGQDVMHLNFSHSKSHWFWYLTTFLDLKNQKP